MPRVAVLCTLLLAAAGCTKTEPAREYTLVGQILAVSPERSEVTIRHEDVKGFMPGMTMAFPVKDRALLEGRQAGDLITATLVFNETKSYLSAITRTGHQPVDTAPQPGFIGLRPGDVVPDTSFVDEAGAVRRLQDWRGHRVALTFIYTRCPVPDFCPLMNRNFASVQDALRQRQDLADVRLLSVTLDPAYDRPAILAAHAKVFKANPAIWSFLTGDEKELATFAGHFGIYIEPDKENPGQIIHSLRTAVIGVDGTLAHNTSGNEWTPTELLAQIAATPAPGH
jgi:protein SCO1/2